MEDFTPETLKKMSNKINLDKYYTPSSIVDKCIQTTKEGLNKTKIDYKLSDVLVSEYRRGGTYKIPKYFDFAMNTYGASLGKEVFEIGTFCQENYVIINNEKYRSRILKVMRETDWKNLYPYISTPKIQTWKIYKHLKQQIPELK